MIIESAAYLIDAQITDDEEKVITVRLRTGDPEFPVDRPVIWQSLTLPYDAAGKLAHRLLELSKPGEDPNPLTEFIDTFSFDVDEAVAMAGGDRDFLLRELLRRLFSNDRYDLSAAKNAAKLAPRGTLWAAIDSATVAL